ncbi:efflux RND transporter periplasmic adaptor subunit [Undibacterium sp. Xuan67W]|uniref:efflux RND transporter periplasmic adaptor subunit n=1 Tax=Undibacterium sp. Xuan67W TaxID=3413057 RepID=UPI003BF5DF7B
MSGTVVAPAGAISLLSAPLTGVVQAIHVNSLQEVHSGTSIATLFSQQFLELQRDYLQLATQSQLASEKHARDEALYKDGIIALSRLQESRAAAAHAEVATYERLQALKVAGMSDISISNILKTKSLSPYISIITKTKGIILELNAQLGQRIEAGMPIAKLGSNQAFWIEFQASRIQADQVHIGDLLQLKNCGTVKVIAISPQMDGSNQSTLIRAQELTHDGCLKLNQFTEASHIGNLAVTGSVGIPATALIRSGGQYYVFIKNANGFKVGKVEIVAGTPDRIWVTGDLIPGQQVATQGIIALKGAWMGLGAEPIAEPKASGSGGKK